jgi:hypothetical protein
MVKPFRVLLAAGCLTVLLAPLASSQDSRKKVNDESDLPRFTYPMSSRASELLQADVTIFNAFAAKVRTDLETILRDYEVADKATVRSWLAAKLDLQLLGGENEAALETEKMIRGLEEKPSPRGRA